MNDDIPVFLQDLPAAYQLHYHVGLAPNRKQPFFASPEVRRAIESALRSVCERNHYHLLDHALVDRGLYLLLSLRPEHSVSGAVKAIKGNLWAAVKNLGDPQPVWSRGIFVRSVGTVNAERVATYVSTQFAHHEVDPVAFEPVSYQRNLAAMSALRNSAHVVFELNHHFVFVLDRRECFLEPEAARGLVGCLVDSAARQGVLVWRGEVVPDHVHLVTGLEPSHIPADVASRFLADSWRWLHDRYAAVLRFERLENVWRQSYYVGTVGAATTAQVRASLQRWVVA
ncbi:MAG: IS200/IS605 family transposase [Armatimonadetes bacterium]|nr:IS200/IS605 family transposase [Armatimonadota bacterium]